MPYANKELSLDDQTHMEKEIDYLRSENVVVAVGHEIPMTPFMPIFGNEDETHTLDVNELIKKEQEGWDICLPFLSRDTNAPPISEEMRRWDLLRTYAKNFIVNNDLHSTPMSVHYDPSQIPLADSSASQALSLTIENFVMPPENMPWQDLLQFRLVDENQKLIRNFRLWLHEVSSTEENPNIIVEKLHYLIDEYKKYMLIQHNKYSLAKLEMILTAAPTAAALTSSLLPAAGAAAASVVALAAAGVYLQSKHIALEEAEFSAPGSEVSYLIKAQNFTR